jgi:hypothetical protein
MNSKDGLSAITGARAHFISSLKRNQVTELTKINLQDFSETYTTENEKQSLSFGFPTVVISVSYTVNRMRLTTHTCDGSEGSMGSGVFLDSDG